MPERMPEQDQRGQQSDTSGGGGTGGGTVGPQRQGRPGSGRDETAGRDETGGQDETRGRNEPGGRNETPEERADRRWAELIQEIRVAQTGVQILFGFLLTVVFAPTFGELPSADKTIYITTVALGACATGALIGPVSFHRIVSGRRIKPQAVVWASRLTFAGLVLLLATLISALFLVLRVATHDEFVPWLVTGVVAWYVLCWFVLPLWARIRYTTLDD